MQVTPIASTPSVLETVPFQAEVNSAATVPVLSAPMAATAFFLHSLRGLATCASRSPRSSHCLAGIEEDTNTDVFA